VTLTEAGEMVAPDLTRRRADATLVEASVTARLLGMRILRIDATVALVPAEVAIATPPVVTPPVVTPPLETPPVETRAAYAPGRSFGAPRGRAGAVGPRLADAVRNLDEGAKVLAKVRRAGS
jgi:hypothetical protein